MPDRDEQTPVINRLVWWLVIGNALAVAGLFLYALFTADMLPEQYPVHFDGSGRPDRWAAAGGWEWYAVPGFGAIMALMMVGLALGLPRIPLRLWNLPGKQILVSLSPARRAPVIRSTVVFVLVLSLLTSLLCFEIQRSMFAAVQLQRMSSSFLPELIAFGVVYIVYIVWWTVRARGLIRRAAGDDKPSGA